VFLAVPLIVANDATVEDQVIHSCVNNNSGEIKITDSSDKCKGNSDSLDWNAIGPQGEKGDTGATGATGATGDTGAAGAKGDTGAAGSSILLGAVQLIGPFGSGGSTDFAIQCPDGTVATGFRGVDGPGSVVRAISLRCTEIAVRIGISALTGATGSPVVNLGATSNTPFPGTVSVGTVVTADCPSGMVMTGFKTRFTGDFFRQFTGSCTEAGPGSSTGNTLTISAFPLGSVTTINCPAGTLITGMEGKISSHSNPLVQLINIRCQ
jgi:hypothetical protein